MGNRKRVRIASSYRLVRHKDWPRLLDECAEAGVGRVARVGEHDGLALEEHEDREDEAADHGEDVEKLDGPEHGPGLAAAELPRALRHRARREQVWNLRAQGSRAQQVSGVGSSTEKSAILARPCERTLYENAETDVNTT